MAESLIGGGAYLNLDASRQALIGGWLYVDDRTAAIGTAIYRPSADVTDGNWTDEYGATVLWGYLAESNVDDATYIMSGANPTADAVTIAIAPAVDSGIHTNHVVRYRIKAQGTLDMTVELIEGGSTVRKTWTHSPAPTEWTTYEQALTEGEAATITDYATLKLRVTAG